MTNRKAIPEHVAIIMDGNGRWAKQRNKERYEGHIAGVESVRAVVRAAVRRGVSWLTLYAFSTENWGRPSAEVDAIMELFCRTVASEAEDLANQGVRVRIMGERTRFSTTVLEMIDRIEEATKGGERLTLVLAFNYSSRREMVLAAQNIARRVANGELSADAIDEATFAASLMTYDIPDPDLIIRTSGECRLSNFLLWQCAYSELAFTDSLWPDFTPDEFEEMDIAFGKRSRRFGGR